MEIDLVRIKELAKEREGENFAFRSFLKVLDISDKRLDSIVRRITREVSAQIDCGACRNCCKRLSPAVSKKEIINIAKYLKIPQQEFEERYSSFNKRTATYILRSPCPFFQENSCLIEDVRPEMCRTYPYLLKKEFRFRLLGVIANYEVCPIVFNVYEELKRELWRGKSRRFMR